MGRKKIIERSITEEERGLIATLCDMTRKHLKLAANAEPETAIAVIGKFIDAVRSNKKKLPEDSDLVMGIGALWGEQLQKKTGWQWVHVTYPDGFASYGLVPEDRACACFPLNDIPEQLEVAAREENTSILLFNMIVAGRYPDEEKGAYTPFG